ncbi:unnamed protein product [Diplocarpon coronariae]
MSHSRFSCVFLSGGASHFYTHEINHKMKHKFHISALMFDFCLVRTINCVLRIVWAFRSDIYNLILSDLIFQNADHELLSSTVLLFAGAVVRMYSFILEIPAEEPRAPESKDVFNITDQKDQETTFDHSEKTKRFYFRTRKVKASRFMRAPITCVVLAARIATVEWRSCKHGLGGANLMKKSMRQHFRRVIHILGFPAEFAGMPMDCGD